MLDLQAQRFKNFDSSAIRASAALLHLPGAKISSGRLCKEKEISIEEKQTKNNCSAAKLVK